MKTALLRGAVTGAAFAVAIGIPGQDNPTPAAGTRTPIATNTPIDSTPTPTQRPDAPPPDAGLMKPSPGATPRASSEALSQPGSFEDCAENGWRAHTNPKFKDRKACEAWVQKRRLSAGRGKPRPAEPNSGEPAFRSAIPVRA